MSKNAAKKKQKREDLLRSAYSLFTTVGYHRTAILAIALKAGVSKGSFYNYFRDKEDIRDSLIILKSRELLKDAMRHLSLAESSVEPVEKLILLIDYILDRLGEDLALLRFVSKNLTWGLFIESGKYELLEEGDTFDFRAFVSHLLEEDGITPNKKVELTIFTIIELINSTCYNVILYGNPTPIDQYKPFLYDCVRKIFRMGIAE